MRAARAILPFRRRKPRLDRGKARTMGVHKLRAVVKLQIANASGCHPPADAAPLVQNDGRKPGLCQPPRAGKSRYPRPDDDDHGSATCSKIRGMFCLTLKNPAVAWGQIAVSQSRRHSHRVMPAASKAGAAWSSQSRNGPRVT